MKPDLHSFPQTFIKSVIKTAVKTAKKQDVSVNYLRGAVRGTVSVSQSSQLLMLSAIARPKEYAY